MTVRLTSLLVLGLFLWPGRVCADDLEIVVNGVEGAVQENVRAYVAPFRIAGTGRMSPRRAERLRVEAEMNARKALRPFGYYQPVVSARIAPSGETTWRLQVDIEPGPPVVIAAADIGISGAGAELPGLTEWRRQWPLTPGRPLDQPSWQAEKQRALNIAADSGYLQAEFTRQQIDLDLERNEAQLELALDTGEQAVMGEVRFHQQVLRPYILENLPRFQPGDPYDAWMMERFRLDLWQAGFFSTIEVVEDRQLDDDPPRVDLDVRLEPRLPNTYQGTIGFGSDTGPRIQFSWDRHLLSERGDSFSLATGWQDHNDEFFIRSGYRVPRKVRSRQAWIAEGLIKRENEDLKVSNTFDSELVDLGNLDISDYSVRLGRLRIHDRKRGFRQLFETWYVQYLYEKLDYRLAPETPLEVLSFTGRDAIDPTLGQTSQNLSIGIEYELPYTRGQGFETVGQHHRGWAFLSNQGWGSDRDFGQIYLSTRWISRAGERWKFLARAELGYSDSDVNDIAIDVDGQLLELSVTRLPNLYRFKAGGSTSVRGYGFESLSNNHIGSNNIITASLEAEYRLFDKWSLAAFYDVGNAFNHWGDPDLKRGMGVGLRWYTIAGTMRVDVAQGLDLPGDPWRVHFTIGASVL
jgi:translocation and assembly module TamA